MQCQAAVFEAARWLGLAQHGGREAVPRGAAAVQAAEASLAAGAVVVADNAGVFAAGGLAGYLAYVRGSARYRSRFVPSTLEWRDDVPDGLEVSVYVGEGAEQ
jgi:predicted O-methyltransferase YrrM